MVLLKNDNKTLPLQKSVKKIAVIGPLADSTRDIEGGWTVEGLFGGAGKSHPVTVLAGIKNKLGPDAQVTYVAGPPMARLYPSLFDMISGARPPAPPTPEEDGRLAGQDKGCGCRCGCGGGGAGRTVVDEQRIGFARDAGFAGDSAADAGDGGGIGQAGCARA
jgi:hypothetical protein